MDRLETMSEPMQNPHHVHCAEVWGGNQNVDMETMTSTLSTSLYSVSCQGGQGGDFYFYSVCGHDKLSRIILGDVVGHGDSVSPISEWVYREMVEHANTLAGYDILVRLNERINERGLEAMSTAVVASYYIKDKKFRFSYAGHYPVFIRRADEREWWPAVIDSAELNYNLPLGIREGTQYHQHEIDLVSNDAFLMFTDGVVEARNRADRMMGVEGLLQILNSIPENDPAQIKRSVIASMEAHCHGNTLHDDISFIAVKIL